MKENYTALYPNEEVSRNVGDYCNNHSTPIPTSHLDYHQDASANHPMANYMISPFQASFQLWMAKALGAKRILEIGCFIGFSAMGWSEAVGPDGHVTTLEFSAEYAETARAGFENNNIKNVEVIVGDAKESGCDSHNILHEGFKGEVDVLPLDIPIIDLKKLAEDLTEPFDLVFIDADKTSYPIYLKQLLDFSSKSSRVRLLKTGGIILADNVLRRALVADDSDANPYSKLAKEKMWKESDMAALKEFNKMMVEELRLETFLMPMFDGLGMARLKD